MTSLIFRLLGGWGIYTWQKLSSCHSGGFRSCKELGDYTKGKESQKTQTHKIGQGVEQLWQTSGIKPHLRPSFAQVYGGGQAPLINQNTLFT